tara:strand:- start:302 stop:529 length:228 start_codon:yes stop_codon:yes gene_type:complete
LITAATNVQDDDEMANNSQPHALIGKLSAKIKAPITPAAVPNHFNKLNEYECSRSKLDFFFNLHIRFAVNTNYKS